MAVGWATPVPPFCEGEKLGVHVVGHGAVTEVDVVLGNGLRDTYSNVACAAGGERIVQPLYLRMGAHKPLLEH